MSLLWIFSLYCRTQGFFWDPQVTKGLRVIVKAKASRGPADGIVCSFLRKVTSFLLYSKERKLAGFQVGYPDWKSPLTLRFAPSLPWFWCRFLKEECDVYTCRFAHTRCDGHMTHLVILFRFEAQGAGRGGGEETGWENRRLFLGSPNSSVWPTNSCYTNYLYE